MTFFRFGLLLLFFVPVLSGCVLGQDGLTPEEKVEKERIEKAERFRFRSFASREDIREAFREMFPPGTPKAFVDHILIEKAGARLFDKHRETLRSEPKYFMVSYIEPVNIIRSQKLPNHHLFVFDEDNKIINIQHLW